MSTPVAFLNPTPHEHTPDLFASGYTHPGWYFWDESGYYCVGPFASEEEAREKLEKYMRGLEGEESQNG